MLDFFPLLPLFGFLLFVVLIIPPYWRLWRRTGHHGAWSLFLLLPVTNIAALYLLAFKRWPRFPGNRP